jgi:hypothetical protein
LIWKRATFLYLLSTEFSGTSQNFQIPEAQAQIKLGLESCWRSGINCSLLVRAIVEILGFEIIKECVSVEIPEKAGFNTGDGFCVILARKPVASR